MLKYLPTPEWIKIKFDDKNLSNNRNDFNYNIRDDVDSMAVNKGVLINKTVGG